MRDFHPVRYTVTVNKYSNRHPGSSSHNTPAPGGTLQTDSNCCVAFSPASNIASSPTPLSGLENLPNPIPNPDARAIITNPLQLRSPERIQRHRHWQLQLQAVATPRSMVSGSCSIHRFVHSDMTCLVFANGYIPGALHVEQTAV
jgi:hypothetical protein